MAEHDFFERRPFRQLRGTARCGRGCRWPLILLVGAIVGIGASMSYFTVEAYEKAVVLRFGKLHSIRGPGLHFKVPLVDKAVSVRIDENSLALPYGIRSAGRGEQMQDHSVRRRTSR